MMKKLLSIVLTVFLLLSLTNVAFGSEAGLPKVVDNADLLTEDETSRLSDLANGLTEELEIDIIIVTTWGLDGKTAMEYADDFYDQNGYGCGPDNSGILLLLAMESREWYMSTCGEAIYIFTDYGLDRLGEQILPYLSDGAYFDAFRVWMNALPGYVDAYRNGSPYDGYVEPDEYIPVGGEEIVHYQPDAEIAPGARFLIALVIGAVAALIVVLIMRSKMNTARFQKHAVDYLKDGSYRMHRRSDVYLYSRVSKTPKPKNNGGGGSSVHRSSGGVRHGGRGGRF